MGLSTFKGTYQTTISSPTTAEVITHNLGVSTPVVDVWVDDTTWKKIQPLSIKVGDAGGLDQTNKVYITFSDAPVGDIAVMVA